MKKINLLQAKDALRTQSLLPCTAALMAVALMGSEAALAFSIPIDNRDFSVRLDTTVRYNLGMRLEDADDRWSNNSAFDESNLLFKDKGDIITNRLDLLSEFDLTYKGRHGVRVSAAAWYDHAYAGKDPRQNPAFGGNTSYDGKFSGYVDRYYAGPSGEFLDAFAYTKFDVGGTQHDLKVGRHAVLWGESMFGNTHGVSYSQTANDGRKGLSSPGASAKETALPMGQVSLHSQLSDSVMVGLQYVWEWRENRVPEGGTYFGGADSIMEGPPRVSPTIGRGDAKEGAGGDIGVMLRVRPDWLNGTMGFYYRKFDDKNAWGAQFAPNPDRTLAVYAKDVTLYGMSIAKEIGGVAYSGEVSYRKDGALSSAGAAGSRYEGAIGNTYHALLNASMSLPTLPLYDFATASAELSYARLDKITKNEQLFNPNANKEYFGLGISITPQWSQVFPGVDLSAPIFVNLALDGNAPNNGGGNENFNTYKVGLQAVYQAVHQFDLAVQWWDVDTTRTPVSAGALQGARTPNGAPYDDKAFLQFTYQYQF